MRGPSNLIFLDKHRRSQLGCLYGDHSGLSRLLAAESNIISMKINRWHLSSERVSDATAGLVERQFTNCRSTEDLLAFGRRDRGPMMCRFIGSIICFRSGDREHLGSEVLQDLPLTAGLRRPDGRNGIGVDIRTSGH